MQIDDQWEALAAAIPEVLQDAQATLRDPLLLALVEERFRAGAETFGDSWLTRDMDWFAENALEEAADLLVYLAMEWVRAQVLHA